MNNPHIERVAETHFMIRPVLESTLRDRPLSDYTRNRHPQCATYYDLWIQQYSHHFFDIGSLIRAAASVESVLRDYFIYKMGYANMAQLRQDPNYSQNIFQRIMPWHTNNCASSLFLQVGFDLLGIPELPIVQELMLHRHLYAHNLGVIDDQYIGNLITLTARDLRLEPTIRGIYPNDDCYWFEPLGRLGEFIEKVRSFSSRLI